MSTVDPDKPRTQRAPLVRLWATLIVVSGALLFGPGMVVAALAQDPHSSAAGAVTIGGFVVACNLAVWSIMFYLRGLGRTNVLAGRGRRAIGLIVMGVGLGAAAAVAALIRQQLAGNAPSSTFLLNSVVMAVVALLIGLWLYSTAVSWEAAAERVKQSGVRTEGVVTHVKVTGTKVNGVPRVKFTVRFTDGQGVQRFVQGARLVPYFSSPSEGQTTAVWYDPNDPGNTHKIVVDLFS